MLLKFVQTTSFIKVKEVSDDGSATKNDDFSSFEIKQ